MPALPERLKEEIEILDGEYVVLPEYKSAGALIAEVCHVHRNGVGAKLSRQWDAFRLLSTPEKKLRICSIHIGAFTYSFTRM
jgi:hypothetical protein